MGRQSTFNTKFTSNNKLKKIITKLKDKDNTKLEKNNTKLEKNNTKVIIFWLAFLRDTNLPSSQFIKNDE